jgi:hypothetical protein
VSGRGAVACGGVLLKVLEDLVHRLSSAERRRACAAMWGVK